MIALVNIETGERQLVASLDGIGPEWQVLADPAPADVLTAPYLVQNGVLMPDLAAARAAQRAIINAARDAAQDGGANTPAGRFDTTERSRAFLAGAVTTALLAQAQGQAFSMTWTRADNSTVVLDAAGVFAAGVAVALHVDAMQARARVLKGRIDAATTLAAIAAVAWTLQD